MATRHIQPVNLAEAHVVNPSPLLQQALREGSNLALDWLWYAGQVAGIERNYCLARAVYIDPKTPVAADDLAALQAQPEAQSSAVGALRLRQA